MIPVCGKLSIAGVMDRTMEAIAPLLAAEEAPLWRAPTAAE
jgi:hypothetical protein